MIAAGVSDTENLGAANHFPDLTGHKFLLFGNRRFCLYSILECLTGHQFVALILPLSYDGGSTYVLGEVGQFTDTTQPSMHYCMVLCTILATMASTCIGSTCRRMCARYASIPRRNSSKTAETGTPEPFTWLKLTLTRPSKST